MCIAKTCPLPEPVEGGLLANKCRRFESSLDATLGGHEPTRDWRGGRKPVAPGNGVGRAPRNPGKPVAQRGGGRNLAKEWMVERLYAPSKNIKMPFVFKTDFLTCILCAIMVL